MREDSEVDPARLNPPRWEKGINQHICQRISPSQPFQHQEDKTLGCLRFFYHAAPKMLGNRSRPNIWRPRFCRVSFKQRGMHRLSGTRRSSRQPPALSLSLRCAEQWTRSRSEPKSASSGHTEVLANRQPGRLPDRSLRVAAWVLWFRDLGFWHRKGVSLGVKRLMCSSHWKRETTCELVGIRVPVSASGKRV